ncbi:hypothetical protein [Paenibacillus sp. MMO-58]|uniref:hypothetical protein n=1 Tax=Paenibacillus sp. MMO-58 TaxID=3081290 RepID=UPI003019FAA3
MEVGDEFLSGGEGSLNKPNIFTVNPILEREPQTKPDEQEKKKRKQRSDKIHNVKFPVTSDQWVTLRKWAMDYGMGKKQSEYNTKLIIAALNDKQIIEAYYHQPTTLIYQEGHYTSDKPVILIPYKDTGKHMHVKLIEIYHDEIVRLMLKWELPKRQTVHRLIMAAIKRGVKIWG